MMTEDHHHRKDDDDEEVVRGSESRQEEEALSSLTMEKVAAAKKFIENHYRAQMNNIKERKERTRGIDCSDKPIQTCAASFYKHRLRSYMDSEIMAFMSQYMPLANQQNVEGHNNDEPVRHNFSV